MDQAVNSEPKSTAYIVSDNALVKAFLTGSTTVIDFRQKNVKINYVNNLTVNNMVHWLDSRYDISLVRLVGLYLNRSASQ